MPRVPEDIGCDNEVCIDSPKCERTVIYKDKTARELKTFGGTEKKGCGKFIPKKEKS